MASEDHFNDINLGAFGAGALSGQGADDHYATTSAATPMGMEFVCACDACGSRMGVTVSWDECIFISQGVPPPGNPASASPAWGYARGGVYPPAQCPTCRRSDTLLLFTPDEAERHLRAGIQAGYVAASYVAQNKPRAAAMRRQGG